MLHSKNVIITKKLFWLLVLYIEFFYVMNSTERYLVLHS